MTLFVYNTLSRSKEEFVPLNGKHVNMFVCGLTPYDDDHLGHAKTFISFDIIVRWLRRSGYEVRYVQNITDIEDKIIKRANERNMDPFELERHYEKRFLDDMEALGVKQNVDMYPRSHDYIEDMKKQIQLLIEKGYAYCAEGDVYYDVSKFGDYTNLSHMNINDLENHRIEPDPKKRNVYDFALWKAAKPGEPSWKIKLEVSGKESEFVGRPGWHIEDTAITYSIFGPQYDLHGGASELIFPHHTNEIAQAEAAFGVKPFVKYWLHTGIVNINGAQMSKSKHNFITIKSVFEKFNPEVLRTLCASTHYSNELNYSESMMKDAKKRLGYMNAAFSIFYNMREAQGPGDDDAAMTSTVASSMEEFESAMNDNFNTALALSKLIILINELRNFAEIHQAVGAKLKSYAVSSVKSMASIFGILENEEYKKGIPIEADILVKRRDALRKEGKFGEADRIRDELRDKYGVSLEDTEYGSIWFLSA